MHAHLLFRLVAASLVIAATAGATKSDPAADGAHHPSLSDRMGLMQLRHIKLWYAGSNRNWPLLRFEAAKMDEAIELASREGDVPDAERASLERALELISTAARRQDEDGFQTGYAKVTDGCNACHGLSKVGFIRITTPTRSPFSDQSFESHAGAAP